MKIGFVGLGIMGESMCENIIKKHDDSVYVFDFVKEGTDIINEPSLQLRDLVIPGVYISFESEVSHEYPPNISVLISFNRVSFFPVPSSILFITPTILHPAVSPLNVT